MFRKHRKTSVTQALTVNQKIKKLQDYNNENFN